METKLDTRPKPPLSSTKSIDEGFESDPDREHSTDSEQNSLLPATGTFDVVQLTDRDGVHHTQIARRPTTTYPNNTTSSGTFESDNRATGTVVKINPKVTIPRAGQRGNALPTVTTTAHNIQHNTFRRSPTKGRPSLGIGGEVKAPRSHSAETIRLRANILPTASSQRYHLKGNSGQQHYLGGHYPSMNHNAVIQNASSLYTFYPAEGSISLYPSQYGLRYKSSHLNVEEQAPVSAMWTQSIPRHSRR